MRLPNVDTNIAVLLMAAAITAVTWIVIITARFPNPAPASATPAVATQAARPPSTRAGDSITYVDIHMKDRPRTSPKPSSP